MTPWLVDVLGTLYVVTGLVAAGIMAPMGLRTVRAMLLANKPHSTIGWIFAPFWLLVMIGLFAFALYFLMTIWPVVAIVIIQRRRRNRAIARVLDVEEEAELFSEARRARLGR